VREEVTSYLENAIYFARIQVRLGGKPHKPLGLGNPHLGATKKIIIIIIIVYIEKKNYYT
jgi:hypothetical protein